MNKRLIYSGFIIVVFLSICVYLYFYFASKEKEEETLRENKVWVEEKAIDLEIEDMDRNKILDFIEYSLPKKIDVKNRAEYFHDAIDIEKMSDEELQERVFAELYYSIKQKDVDMLVTLFDINSYMEFVDLFQNHDELVDERLQLLNSISRSGTFESVTYIRRDERLFTVIFNYKTGDQVKLNMKIKRYTEDGTKDHYYYAISSSFIDFYESFNPSK